MKKLMGIDIGGTKCAVLLAEAGAFSDVRFIEKTAFPTDAEKGFNHTREKIFSAVTALTEKYGAGNISAIGVCCGSPLDSRRGVIKSPPNLPGWDNIPITQMLYDCFGIPAYLQNDANACALAEWRLGAGRGAENMIFLTMGTGFGAGIIAHGKIIEGKDGLCGEIGHVRLAPDGPEGYGKSGSAEGFCSGGGIAKLALIMADRWEAGGDAPVWINEKDDMDAKRLAEYAANGDRHAVAVYEKAGEKLGEAVAILIDLLNPERIVIGSVFARSENLLRASMERVLKREALQPSLSSVEILPARLGEAIGDYAAITAACYGMGLSFGRPGEETDGEVLAIYEKLFKRYPALDGIRASFMNAYLLLRDAYRRGNKLLVCGNGGSAADSGHIVGELMKGFMKKRGIGRLYNEESADLLQGALPAIDLTQHTALNTAVANDNSPDLMFAQQVLGYGAAGDVLLAISTSGNAENCRRAALTAKAKNLAVIALTGPDGGRLAEIADCAVKAPGDCTADIQEHHLPVYHTLCAMLEEKFF